MTMSIDRPDEDTHPLTKQWQRNLVDHTYVAVDMLGEVLGLSWIGEGVQGQEGSSMATLANEPASI